MFNVFGSLLEAKITKPHFIMFNKTNINISFHTHLYGDVPMDKVRELHQMQSDMLDKVCTESLQHLQSPVANQQDATAKSQ